jgi:hypothetical protein
MFEGSVVSLNNLAKHNDSYFSQNSYDMESKTPDSSPTQLLHELYHQD